MCRLASLLRLMCAEVCATVSASDTNRVTLMEVPGIDILLSFSWVPVLRPGVFSGRRAQGFHSGRGVEKVKGFKRA